MLESPYVGPTYTVERIRFCHWVIIANTRYHWRYIAKFWTKQGAQKVADQLNWFKDHYDQFVADEADYDKRLNQWAQRPQSCTLMTCYTLQTMVPAPNTTLPFSGFVAPSGPDGRIEEWKQGRLVELWHE